MTHEEIAKHEQFLVLPHCFPLLVIGYLFNCRDFLFSDTICSKSSATELSYEGKGLYWVMLYCSRMNSFMGKGTGVNGFCVDPHSLIKIHDPLT